MADFDRQEPNVDGTARYRGIASRVGLAFFVFVLASQLAAYGLSLLIRHFFPAYVDAPWMEWTLTIVVLYGVAAPLCWLCLSGVPGEAPHKRVMSPRTWGIFLLIGFTFIIAGSLVGQAVNRALSQLTHSNQGSQITEAMNGSTLWLSCLYSLVIAPVMEELFFRKLLLDRMRPLGDGVAILFSGVAFGLFHGNLDQFFYATLLGCLFAYVYLNTGSLIGSVTMHTTLNFFGGVLPLLTAQLVPGLTEANTTEEVTALLKSHPGGMAAYLVSAYLPYLFAIAGAVMLIRYARRLTAFLRPSPIPRGERFSTAVVNPGVILYIAATVILILLSILSQVLISQQVG